jgi:predicted transcriptional regulator
MLAKELINDTVLPLKTSDTGARALSWMDDLKVSHLPIVNERLFLGLLSETDINQLTDLNQPMGNLRLSNSMVYSYDNQHLFDVLNLFYEHKLTLIPVVDANHNYLGCITLFALLEGLAKDSSILNPGGIIVLDVDQNSYDLAEIAKIVESNDAKILALHVTETRDSTMLSVTIKVNKMDISSLIQTFTRYQYMISATFAEKDDLDELKERYDSLMNYLNI